MKTTAALLFTSLLCAASLLGQTPAPRGDFNIDGSVNTTDINGLSDHLLGSGAGPARVCAADVNADSGVSPMDALRLIDFVVAAGQAPPSQPAEICDESDNNCDGQADENFNKTTDSSNCGTCGNVCQSANSVNTCMSGDCVPTCNSGFATCDGNGANGCETSLNTNVACTTNAFNIGAVRGDAGGDFLSTNGRGEVWIRFRLLESNSSSVNLRARVALFVPSGIDYDLYVYRVSCGGQLAGSSTTTTDEAVVVQVNDGSIFDPTDNSTDFYVEVRFHSGSSCINWTLTVQGNV